MIRCNREITKSHPKGKENRIFNRLISQMNSSNKMNSKLPYSVSSKDNIRIVTIDNSAKGDLTIFWEHFIVIPCAPSHLKIIKNIGIRRYLGHQLTLGLF